MTIVACMVMRMINKRTTRGTPPPWPMAIRKPPSRENEGETPCREVLG